MLLLWKCYIYVSMNFPPNYVGEVQPTIMTVQLFVLRE